jgi:hypothetical protein
MGQGISLPPPRKKRLSDGSLTALAKPKRDNSMSRAAYCREQAQLCRALAAQLSLRQDAERLREEAERHEAEANALETPHPQQSNE